MVYLCVLIYPICATARGSRDREYGGKLCNKDESLFFSRSEWNFLFRLFNNVCSRRQSIFFQFFLLFYSYPFFFFYGFRSRGGEEFLRVVHARCPRFARRIKFTIYSVTFFTVSSFTFIVQDAFIFIIFFLKFILSVQRLFVFFVFFKRLY